MSGVGYIKFLNPEKCFSFQEINLYDNNNYSSAIIPQDWITQLINLTATYLTNSNTNNLNDSNIANLINQNSEKLFKNLNKHIDKDSNLVSNNQKNYLLDLLRYTYYRLNNDSFIESEKTTILVTLAQAICSPCFNGFLTRTSELISEIQPKEHTLNNYLLEYRKEIVKKIATKACKKFYGLNPHLAGDEVHTYSRFFSIASLIFGIEEINSNDEMSHISDAEILDELKKGFAIHYNIFAILNWLTNKITITLKDRFLYRGQDQENPYSSEECLSFLQYFQQLQLWSDDTEATDFFENLPATNISFTYLKMTLFKQMVANEFFNLNEYQQDIIQANIENLQENESLLILGISICELGYFISYQDNSSIEAKFNLINQYLQKNNVNYSDESGQLLQLCSILDDKNSLLIAKINEKLLAKHSLQILNPYLLDNNVLKDAILCGSEIELDSILFCFDCLSPEEQANILLHQTTNFQDNLFHIAIKTNVKAFEKLFLRIKTLEPVVLKNTMLQANYFGTNIIMLAAFHKKTTILKLLLKETRNSSNPSLILNQCIQYSDKYRNYNLFMIIIEKLPEFIPQILELIMHCPEEESRYLLNQRNCHNQTSLIMLAHKQDAFNLAYFFKIASKNITTEDVIIILNTLNIDLITKLLIDIQPILFTILNNRAHIDYICQKVGIDKKEILFDTMNPTNIRKLAELYIRSTDQKNLIIKWPDIFIKNINNINDLNFILSRINPDHYKILINSIDLNKIFASQKEVIIFLKNNKNIINFIKSLEDKIHTIIPHIKDLLTIICDLNLKDTVINPFLRSLDQHYLKTITEKYTHQELKNIINNFSDTQKTTLKDRLIQAPVFEEYRKILLLIEDHNINIPLTYLNTQRFYARASNAKIEEHPSMYQKPK